MSSRKLPAADPARQVNFRLQLDVWEWLAAAAGALGRSQSAIVAEALQHYRMNMPAPDQKLIEQSKAARRRTR